MAKVYATTDMGMQRGVTQSAAKAFKALDAYKQWVARNPRMQAAFDGALPMLAFFTSSDRADMAARICRARRLEVKGDAALRQANLLEYKAYRKISALVRKPPKDRSSVCYP